jgi:hypothetical protein
MEQMAMKVAMKITNRTYTQSDHYSLSALSLIIAKLSLVLFTCLSFEIPTWASDEENIKNKLQKGEIKNTAEYMRAITCQYNDNIPYSAYENCMKSRAQLIMSTLPQLMAFNPKPTLDDLSRFIANYQTNNARQLDQAAGDRTSTDSHPSRFYQFIF